MPYHFLGVAECCYYEFIRTSTLKSKFPFLKFISLTQKLILVSLSYRFVHQDCGRDGYIERIQDAKHRNTNMGISGFTPLIGETCCLRAHDYGRGESHVGIVIER